MITVPVWKIEERRYFHKHLRRVSNSIQEIGLGYFIYDKHGFIRLEPTYIFIY